MTTAYMRRFARQCRALFAEPGVHLANKADLPERVDGQWRCGRCKVPMFGTGRCLACWPAPDDGAPS